jgi:hypothetical protein
VSVYFTALPFNTVGGKAQLRTLQEFRGGSVNKKGIVRRSSDVL